MSETKQYYIKVERYDWVEVTDHFRGVEALFHSNRRRVMLKLLKQYGNNPLLDVGCGTGLILKELPNCIGLDINRWALEKAKSYGCQNLVVGDAENLPFKPNCFSTVICTETLEHLPHPRKALKEIWNLLRKKGHLAGSVPHRSLFWNFRFLSSTCPHQEPFHNEYSRSQMQKLLSPFKTLILKFSSLHLNIVFVTEKP